MEFIFFTKIRIEKRKMKNRKKKNERERSGLSWFESRVGKVAVQI